MVENLSISPHAGVQVDCLGQDVSQIQPAIMCMISRYYIAKSRMNVKQLYQT